MKLAITVWNQRIAPVFDSAGKAVIVGMQDRHQVQRQEVELDRADPAGNARMLRELGVRELICGAISREVEDLVLKQGIRVFPFVAGELEAVLDAWIVRQLDNGTYAMPGCGRHRRHGRGRSQVGGRTWKE